MEKNVRNKILKVTSDFCLFVCWFFYRACKIFSTSYPDVINPCSQFLPIFKTPFQFPGWHVIWRSQNIMYFRSNNWRCPSCLPTCILDCDLFWGCGLRGLLHPEEDPQVPPSRSSARSCNLHWPAVSLNTTLSAIEGYRNLWSRSVAEEIISSYHAEYPGPASGCTHHSFLHEQHLITMSSWAQCSLHWRLDWYQQAVPSRQCPLQHKCSLLSRGIRDYCQSPHGWVMNSRFFSTHQDDFFQNKSVPLTGCFLVLLFWHLVGKYSSFLMVLDWAWLQRLPVHYLL